MTVRRVLNNISLGFGPVWSESSPSAWRKLGALATCWAHSEDSDQTGWMPRLIWVFTGRICHFVGFCHEAAHFILLQALQCQCWQKGSSNVLGCKSFYFIKTGKLRHASGINETRRKGMQENPFGCFVQMENSITWDNYFCKPRLTFTSKWSIFTSQPINSIEKGMFSSFVNVGHLKFGLESIIWATSQENLFLEVCATR